MALPKQLKEQSEAISKFYEEATAEGTSPAEQEAVTGEGTPTEPEANGADQSAPEVPRNEQTRATTTVDDTAEQRYRTLQGMYNADTARLRADKQELTARIEQLETLLASFTARPTQTEPPTTERLVTQKDIEEYGDSIEVMRRVTKEETYTTQAEIADLKRTINELRAQVIPRVEQVAQRQARTVEQTFWADLSVAVPDWREINQNKEFHAWLLEEDPLTGTTRQSHLENAQRNFDVRRVTAFFNAWKGNEGHSIAQEPRDAAKSQLEKQVAPGRSRVAAAPVADQAKTYTQRELAKFYDDVRRGVYKGRETERDRLERDIFAAQREGRIVATG